MSLAEGAPFSFVFHGRAADTHSIDMRQLGISLIGFDRLLSDGLILVTEGRLARRKERAPVFLLAQEPVRGSTAIYGTLAPAVAQLPLLWDFVTSGKAKAAMEFVAFILQMRGGRRSDAEVHKENMMEILHLHEAARDRQDERAHQTIRHAIDALTAQAVRQSTLPARQAVAAVGRSVEQLRIGEDEGVAALIDEPMADVIREGGGAQVGDVERLVVDVDGYQHHNRSLKIARIDGAGFMSATVTDPAFDFAPNLYTEAAALKARRVVDAKRTVRDGKVERLHISNAVELIRAA